MIEHPLGAAQSLPDAGPVGRWMQDKFSYFNMLLKCLQ
jgi:hypothetical protein